MNLKKLPLANLARNPGRTAGLVVLVALMSLVVFGGSLVMGGLRTGVQSLEARLGADIMVAPKSAKITNDLESVLVQGVPGSFYMDRAVLDKVLQIEGVQAASPQTYLASLKASCCSAPRAAYRL